MRRIPDDNLSYPLSIELSSGASGSGFVAHAEQSVYLVTARHVLFTPDGSALLAPRARVTGYNRTLPGSPRVVLDLDLDKLLTANELRPHSSSDVTVVRIASLSTEAKAIRSLAFTDGVTPVDLAGSFLSGVDLKYQSKRFAEVLEANEVIVFGYPVSLGINSLQFDPTKPLLRHGIVAAKNEIQRTIILDCPVYPGNSGGLVLEIDRVDGATTHFEAIGVVSQFVPAVERWVNPLYGYENRSMSNSGYSVAVPIDAVDELVSSY